MRVVLRGVAKGYILVLAALLSIALRPAVVSAHEPRDILGGEVRLEAGFLDEPTVEGQINAAYLSVENRNETTADGEGKPIEGLEKTIKVEVTQGGGAQKRVMDLEPRAGMPGQYIAPFIPSRAGDYSFRFFGTIVGQQVDEKFESGPGRFSSVQALSEVQFPPVTAEMATAMDGQITAARNLGLAGIVVGALGLVVGAVAMLRHPANAVVASPPFSGEASDD